MKEKIKEFMESNFLFEFNDEVTEKTNLFTEGYMDSFGFIELITFLESTFDVKFQADELTGNKFGSVEAVIESLKSKGISDV
ncbi:MAG: acyl carrier protein [Gammaproteobacteria bacterium]|nr:acyl carrier protein [Gammaproteobacteria bacterium]